MDLRSRPPALEGGTGRAAGTPHCRPLSSQAAPLLARPTPDARPVLLPELPATLAPGPLLPPRPDLIPGPRKVAEASTLLQ